jgi:ABC-type branched-subunit amino acid transport system substrate-binding protein
MRKAAAKAALVLLGSTIAFGVLILLCTMGAGSSEAQSGSMHNCPQAGKWAISVWDGPDGTETSAALAACGADAVDVAYALDPQTGGWLGWFRGRPEISKLLTLDGNQGVLALGSAAATSGSLAMPGATYVGTTSQDLAIELEVSADGLTIKNVTYRVSGTEPGGKTCETLSSSSLGSSTVGKSIVDNSFAIVHTLFDMSGHFDTQWQATGELTVHQPYADGVPPCDAGPLTWTASIPSPTPTAVPAGPGQMHNCPQAGGWAISVWDGPDDTEADQALATCGAVPVAAAYYLDPQTQAWSHWFAGQPGMTTLSKVNNKQGVIALGGAAVATPTPTAMPTATATPAATPAAGGPLKIGMLFDYTGSLAEFGPNMETGAQLALKQINAAGGVLGKPVELIKADAGTDPNKAVAAANQLVSVQGVQAIVGCLSSGVTIAVAEGVAVPNKIVMISPASTSPGLTAVKDNDFLFRTLLSDAAQGVVLADWAWEQGYKKVATFYTNNAYGKGLSDQFVSSFLAKGGTVTAAVSHEQQQPSYLSELQKAVAGNPEVLVAISYPAEGSVYIKEAIENNLIKKFLFVDGTKSADIIKAVGATALEGTTGTSLSAVENAAATTSFDADYKAEYGKDVPALPYVRESYDAVVAIALAAEAAQSTDPSKIRDQLREVAGPPGQKIGAGADGVKQALQAVRAGTDIDFDGAANSDNFDANGDVLTGAIEIFRITGGEFETVKIVPLSLASP